MKRTLLAVLAMVAGLAFTASALPPLDFDPEGTWTILYIDDPEWVAEDPNDPYSENDGYWGSLVDFLKRQGTDEIMFDCNITPDCEFYTNPYTEERDTKYKRCPTDNRTAVFDGVDLDGILLRNAGRLSVLPEGSDDYSEDYAAFLNYESIPDKAEMMLLATALDNNPDWVTTIEAGRAIFNGFADDMVAMVAWGAADDTKPKLLAAFEVFCEKQNQVAKPGIAGAITYGESPKVTVTLSCATADATINYKYKIGEGAYTAYTAYTGAFEVSGAAGTKVTVKAMATKNTWADSKENEAGFDLATTPPGPGETPVCDGPWEWVESEGYDDIAKAADDDAKAFDGFKINPDPAFYTAVVSNIPVVRSVLGPIFIPQVAAALMPAPPAGFGLDQGTAVTVATHMVMKTATALQIATLLGNPGYESVIQGVIDEYCSDPILVNTFLTLYVSLGGLIGTVAEDLTETLVDDVSPISSVLNMHAYAFTGLEALGVEMNLALTAMLEGLLSDLLAPIEATEDFPGAPEGGYTIPEVCSILGSNNALLGLKGPVTGPPAAAPGGVYGVVYALGLTSSLPALDAAADVLAAGGAAMSVIDPPTLPVLGVGKAGAPPLSPSGDYDGDGITNIEAYQLVTAAGGDYEDFVAAAGGGNGGIWPGNPDLPAAGLFGLAALVSAITAGGAFVLRKK